MAVFFFEFTNSKCVLFIWQITLQTISSFAQQTLVWNRNRSKDVISKSKFILTARDRNQSGDFTVGNYTSCNIEAVQQAHAYVLRTTRRPAVVPCINLSVSARENTVIVIVALAVEPSRVDANSIPASFGHTSSTIIGRAHFHADGGKGVATRTRRIRFEV